MLCKKQRTKTEERLYRNASNIFCEFKGGRLFEKGVYRNFPFYSAK